MISLNEGGRKPSYQIKNPSGHAFYKNPMLTLELFDSLVKSILLYCSDYEITTGYDSTISSFQT